MQIEDLLARYDGFVFDLDGTLVDSMPLHLAGWKHASTLYGFEYDPDWFYNLGGVPSRKIAKLVAETQNIQLDLDAVTKIKADYYQRVIAQSVVFPAMKELVVQLFRQRPLAIGTGSTRTSANIVLANNELHPYFQIITTADDVVHHKPHPDTFLLSAAKLNVKPSQCLVFEDTNIGLQAAHEAQMDCVLIREGKPDWNTYTLFDANKFHSSNKYD
ncbi:HAD family hydrolase [Tolumonas lignilytica]|jgi:haloacid dehalogenase superfamily, subfamily IA, variant 3 with third motif having DD or ED/beta-phosphoglucomutase family hydrolase|uniref:HAD family hydrolase n=1 Tax=Tolumonas lignilytica TaxID=1283284 RepID=UPI000463D2F7|nr:beta-phosphoglucomutase family hydrolase [Tolumonas lignilytica]